MESALSNNLDLAGIWEQFQAAQALVRSEKSFLWPQVDATATGIINESRTDFEQGEDLQVGLAASYEVDLWGRIRAGVQAEGFRARASYYDYQTTAMSLSAEISLTWFQLVSARKQLELMDEQIATNEDILRLIRARFTGGQVRAVDILRQEQLLEATRDQRILYETELLLGQNRLAVLLGRSPQNIQVPEAKNLPGIPPLPETGLPLELVRRRPDVQQAYNFVLAADMEMAQAIRNRYPRLSLEVNAQTGARNYDNLFENWAYTLAGNLAAPLLYGGRLKAEADYAEAVRNQEVYAYGQTVLNAFREVEDALIREKKQQERLQVLQKQLALSRKTNAQLRKEYLNGLTEYLDVLLSLGQQQQLERDLINARQAQLEYRIALYRALAGGFMETGNRETDLK